MKPHITIHHQYLHPSEGRAGAEQSNPKEVRSSPAIQKAPSTMKRPSRERAKANRKRSTSPRNTIGKNPHGEFSEERAGVGFERLRGIRLRQSEACGERFGQARPTTRVGSKAGERNEMVRVPAREEVTRGGEIGEGLREKKSRHC